MTHWAIALYERYAQLYGEPIEQPITAQPPSPDPASDSVPASPGQPRAQTSAPRSS